MKPDKCIDCAFHKVIKDPDPNDSFNYDDVAMVCTKVRNPNIDKSSKWWSDHSEDRPTDVSIRPYQIGNVKPPTWCPL